MPRRGRRPPPGSPLAPEQAFQDQIAQRASEGVWSEKQTEQIILAAARVGQHVFALNVLSNCGQRCVFPLTRQYYGRPPLLESLLLPDDAQLRARKYLDWHKTNVFIA
jgi:hypothetical protein